MKRWILSCMAIIWCSVLWGQNRFVVSGYIRDSGTGEELIGAAVSIQEIPSAGVYTNSYGFYSLTVPAGKHIITASLIGYELLSIPVDLTGSLRLNLDLTQKVTQLKEVTITSEKRNENVTKNQMGVDRLSIQEIKNLPAFLGERDVLKTLQLLPGIKSAGEGNSGFNVRGGTTDQNLILLDGATVYNPSHLMGFFSVFNPDAIKDVTMYKGSLPSEFGGRLSSVLDIRMDEGNSKKIEVSGGIGLISSRLTINGPIVKGKGSFIISARRTYADLVVRTLARAGILKDSTLKDPRLYFYDLNAKANYRFGDKDRIFLSGYFGRDVLGITDFGFDWGNSTATLRWNHLFNDKLFLNTSLIFNDFSYTINNGSTTHPINIVSKIRDYSLKQDYQYSSGHNNQIRFGFESTYHGMVPGTITGVDSNTVRRSLPFKNSIENSVYFSHNLSFSARFNINYGIRISEFSLLGEAPFYKYSSYNLTDSVKSVVDSTSKVISFVKPEPRFSITYLLNEKSSLKASYTRNVQYLHLLSNSTMGSPTDMWIPSSYNTIPELSDQYAFGFYRNFENSNYEFSVETYYKKLFHQVDYINGAILYFNANVESQLIYGKGRAYGLELFLKKKYGRFSGWISYTLSRTERQFDGIDSGKWYPARQDRTHDVSVVAIYELPGKWTISSTWVYNTGNAVTFPKGVYLIDNRPVLLYTDRNGNRMPAYHRLDLSASKQFESKKHYKSSLTFALYNAYSRDNAWSITFRQNDKTGKIEAVQTTLFKLVPSITYNFRF
jgi:TonB dependent receptor-like, beta-barrel/CarboxypepD_reg-like domain/TonB-dependent Receptor Plug Domain